MTPNERFMALFDFPHRQGAAPLKIISPNEFELVLTTYQDYGGFFSVFSLHERLLFLFTGMFRGRRMWHCLYVITIHRNYERAAEFPKFWRWATKYLRVETKQRLQMKPAKHESKQDYEQAIARLKEWFRFRATHPSKKYPCTNQQ